MGSACSKFDQVPEEGIAGQGEPSNARHLSEPTSSVEKSINTGIAAMASPDGQSPLANYTADRDAISTGFAQASSYHDFRSQFINHEKAIGFESDCQSKATAKERHVDSIIQSLRKRDAELYASAPKRKGYGGQMHPRIPGDHFLSNRKLIDQTALLDVARRMPKGAHLHIHFNACLLPNVLLDIAEEMGRMFITSDLPLVPDDDYANFKTCEIQFSLCSKEKESPGNLFSESYQPRCTMKYKDFLESFPKDFYEGSAKKWLMDKLVFHEEEAHNSLQTAAGYAPWPPIYV